MEIRKEYSNKDITVVWQPKKCIHAKECIKHLPKVYKPTEKPWIQIEYATTDELKKQISTCPSGALSYFENNKTEDNSAKITNEINSINILPDGPLIIKGKFQLNYPDEKKEIIEKQTALCRCGFSENKPFCDGSHVKHNFKG